METLLCFGHLRRDLSLTVGATVEIRPAMNQQTFREVAFAGVQQSLPSWWIQPIPYWAFRR